MKTKVSYVSRLCSYHGGDVVSCRLTSCIVDGGIHITPRICVFSLFILQDPDVGRQSIMLFGRSMKQASTLCK